MNQLQKVYSERMSVASRIRPLDLFTEAEWSHLRRRSNVLGLGMVVHCWAIIALAIVAGIWQPWLIPLAIPVIGARQLGLAVLMHEAAHGGLSTSKPVNDFVGQWLTGAPIGAHLGNYRSYHIQHHKFTQQPEDPDLILSAPFPITQESLRRKIIRDMTGQTFWKQRKNQFAKALGFGHSRSRGRENRAQSAREAVIPFLIVNAALLIGLSLAGYAWAYFVLWLFPMATWNMMITRIRNIAEHAVLPDHEDPLRYARTTRINFLEGLLVAPYWVNYHCEHHMFMHLPCYRLGEAHRLLEKKGITARMEVQRGYKRVISMAASKQAMA